MCLRTCLAQARGQTPAMARAQNPARARTQVLALARARDPGRRTLAGDGCRRQSPPGGTRSTPCTRRRSKRAAPTDWHHSTSGDTWRCPVTAACTLGNRRIPCSCTHRVSTARRHSTSGCKLHRALKGVWHTLGNRRIHRTCTPQAPTALRRNTIGGSRACSAWQQMAAVVSSWRWMIQGAHSYLETPGNQVVNSNRPRSLFLHPRNGNT